MSLIQTPLSLSRSFMTMQSSSGRTRVCGPAGIGLTNINSSTAHSSKSMSSNISCYIPLFYFHTYCAVKHEYKWRTTQRHASFFSLWLFTLILTLWDIWLFWNVVTLSANVCLFLLVRYSLVDKLQCASSAMWLIWRHRVVLVMATRPQLLDGLPWNLYTGSSHRIYWK